MGVTGDSKSAAKPSLSSLVREHMTLVVSGTVSLLVCFKVLALSRYDPMTAMAVLQVVGTSQVLLGTLVSLIPSLAALLLYIAYAQYGHHIRKATSVERSAMLAAGGPVVLLLLAISSLGSLLGLAIGLTLLYALIRGAEFIQRRRTPQERREAVEPASPRERSAAALILPAFLLINAVQIPWLPTEAVQVADRPSLTAYVIGSRGGDILYLPTSGGRPLAAAPITQVSRSLCSDSSWMSKSLLTLNGPRYPDCPER